MRPLSKNRVMLPGVVLLGLIFSVVAHSQDEYMDQEMGGLSEVMANSTMAEPGNYFQLTEHTGLMFAHILLMTVGWVFVLPVGELIRDICVVIQ